MKARGCNLKFRSLLKEKHNITTDREIADLPIADKALAMMLVHNTAIKKSLSAYHEEMKLKAEAKE